LYQNLLDENIIGALDSNILKSFDISNYDNLYVFLSHYQVVDPDSTLFKALVNKYSLTNYNSFRKIDFLAFDLNNVIKSDTISKMQKDTLHYNFSNCESCIENDEDSSGKITFVDETRNFSHSFSDNVEFLYQKNVRTIQVKAKTKYTNESDDVRFVVSIENKDHSKSLFYQSVDISDNAKANEWNQIQINMKLYGLLMKDDTIKIYLWNRNKAKAYLKEIEIIY
ncbi:MAG: hypothetical protein KDC05_00350, partial [Bacteroidales bacterium]|nr:hypothetical protein [Bacteroidales bacterium]